MLILKVFFCSHGAFFGCVSDAFSTFKIKHVGFEQRRVHFGDIKSDGQAGTIVGVKSVFKIITIRIVISY